MLISNETATEDCGNRCAEMAEKYINHSRNWSVGSFHHCCLQQRVNFLLFTSQLTLTASQKEVTLQQTGSIHQVDHGRHGYKSSTRSRHRRDLVTSPSSSYVEIAMTLTGKAQQWLSAPAHCWTKYVTKNFGIAFSALTLLVGQQEWHTACQKWGRGW